MKQLKILVLSLAAACSMTPAALAAATQWQDMAGGRMRIIAADPSSGDKVIDALLQIDLAPGWKTYWLDPGEAGVPLQIDIAKSVNAKIKSVNFPAPQRFDDGVTVWAGYDAPVSIHLGLERPDPASAVVLSGNAFFGVCEKICVPVQFDFSLDVKDSAVPTVHHELVAMALADMPKAASPAFGLKMLSTDWHDVSIEATVPEGASDAALFLAPPKGLQFAAPALTGITGAIATFEASISALSRAAIPEPIIVNYTLVTDKGAVSGEIALTKR